jgi:hypothetical protein
MKCADESEIAPSALAKDGLEVGDRDDHATSRTRTSTLRPSLAKAASTWSSLEA